MLIKETVAMSTAVWLVSLLAKSLAQESGDSDCTELPARNQSAYFGWPVIIDGEKVGFHYEFYEEDYDDDDAAKLLQVTMTFKGSDKPFYDLTYDYNDAHSPKGEISNVTTATPTEIEVKAQELNGSSCVTQTVILQPTQLPDLTCKCASNNTKIILKRERIEGGLTELECAVHGEDEPKLDISKYNVTWYYNCGAKLPPNITTASHNKLHFTADHTKHPGIYTCSIQQNEQERFLIANHFCVKPNAWSSLVSLKCPKKITLDEGDTVNITCNVSVPETSVGSDGYHMNFYPLLSNGSKDLSKDNISCTSSLGRNRTFAEDEQASCLFSYVSLADNPKFKCFENIPTRLEWEKEKNKTIRTLRMSYELKNWQIGDLIILQSRIHNQVSGKYDIFNTIIEVLRHPERTALIIGCTVGGCLLILLVVALCFLFRLQIRYWWRQTSCVKYENDVRKFGAYFTYYWENDAGKRTENSQYQQLILSMRKHLSKINCPIYDNNESPALFKWDYDSILHVQEMCDRIVIILTPEYIKNQNNNFELFTNFLESTFVFIKTPGVDDALNSVDQERRTALMVHLKRNHVIGWSMGNRLSRKCRMQLELSMPKRRPQPHVIENASVKFSGLSMDAA